MESRHLAEIKTDAGAMLVSTWPCTSPGYHWLLVRGASLVSLDRVCAPTVDPDRALRRAAVLACLTAGAEVLRVTFQASPRG